MSPPLPGLVVVQKMSGYLINFNWEIRGARKPENPKKIQVGEWMPFEIVVLFAPRRVGVPKRVMNEYVLLFIE